MVTSDQLLAPTLSRGKRSRSNSSSSSTSSSATSSTGSSILSRFTGTDTCDSLSSCSSPATASNETSPYANSQEDGRPCKTLKGCSNTASDAARCSLVNLGLTARGSAADVDKVVAAPCGKTLFVDCLVDAAVHVLNLIWKAPLERTIAFVSSHATTTSNFVDAMSAATCKCPSMPRPMGPIPLDLFVRETLRRSRTSCSTLQTALLLCKRAGGEVVRRRARKEGYTLSEEVSAQLPCADQAYLSLLPIDNCQGDDSILCSRRVFLASVMVSSKFLQDRTFSNRAWSKISGLEVKELSQVERRLLVALNFDLNVKEDAWRDWTGFLKGEWRSGRPKTRCGLQHSISQPVVQSSCRTPLSRTGSLPKGDVIPNAEEVLEADLTLPTGDDRASYDKRFPEHLMEVTRRFPEKQVEVEVEVATPKAIEQASGDVTPKTTDAKTLDTRKFAKAQSLLAAAVYNHMQITSVQS